MLCHLVLLPGLRMQEKNSSCLVTFLFCYTDVMIITVYVSSSSRCSKVFVTVKPVLQGPLTVCLKSHIPLNVTGVLEIILRGGFRAISHLFLTGYWWESQLFPVFPPPGDVSLLREGVRVTRSNCEGGIDKEHLTLLLKTGGEVACEASALLLEQCCL